MPKIKWIKTLLIASLSLTLCLFNAPSLAEKGETKPPSGEEGSDDKKDNPDCPDANLMSGKLITNVCWTCVFPIKIAGVKISGSAGNSPEPSGSTNQRFCMCHDPAGMPQPGVVTQLWEPSHVMEFQRTPGCMPTLAGNRLPFDKTNRGTSGTDDAAEKNHSRMGYRHYHMYAFPIMLMIDIYVPKRCNAGGFADLDLMFVSEVDPTWNRDELSFFVHFENALVANPVATAACIPDAVASNVDRPIDMLWWCAGSWGNLYPLTGNVVGFEGTLTQTSKQLARSLTALHRRGMLYGTVGDKNLCGGTITPRLPKTQYRVTMFWPVPETSDSHVLGESAIKWGLNRMIPSIGEDPVYILWRWMDCCNA